MHAGTSMSTPLSPFAPVDAHVTVTVTPHGQNTPKTPGRNSFPHSTTLSGATTYEGDHAVTSSHSNIRSPYSQGRHAYVGSHTIDSLPTVSESPADRGKRVQNVLSSPSTPSHACVVISSTVPASSVYDGECMTRDVGLQAGSGMFSSPAQNIRPIPFSLNRWGGGFSFLRRNAGSKAVDASASQAHESSIQPMGGFPDVQCHMHVHVTSAEQAVTAAAGNSKYKAAEEGARGAPEGQHVERDAVNVSGAVGNRGVDGHVPANSIWRVDADSPMHGETGMFIPVRLFSRVHCQILGQRYAYVSLFQYLHIAAYRK